MVRRALANPELDHVYFDISWDETAKYLMATPETIQATADLINRYPDRFLFGTDEVAPTEQAKYLKVYDLYAPLFAKLTPEASEKLRKGNYERLFDAARREGPGVGEGEPEVSKEAIVSKDNHRVAAAGGGAVCASAADGAAGSRARRPAPTPAATAAQEPRQGRGEAPDGHLRLRHARHGLPVAARTTPNWFDVLRPTKLPSYENEFGEDGHFFAGVRQSRLGVKGFIPTDARRDQDDLRVRAVRHRRRRRADDVPAAPRLGRARPVRRRPDLEPVHGPRRLPELDRVLGPERHGLLPQRPGPLDALVRTATRASPSPSSGRAPRADQGVYADRIELEDVTARFPLPDLSAQFRYAKRLGPRPGRRHPAPDEVGRPERRPVRPHRQTPPAGASTSARTSSSPSTCSAARWSTARASQNY